MNKSIVGMMLALCGNAAWGQVAPLVDASLPIGSGPQSSPICFYGGDFDKRNGLTCNRNTSTHETWTFDDVLWPGGTITEVWGNFLHTGILPVAADVAIYQGIGECRWGTRIIETWNLTAFTWKPTGRSGYGYDEHELRVQVDIELPPGLYHFSVRPVGTGSGQAWVSTTSGDRSRGEPIGNGNSFLWPQCYFCYQCPTSVENVLGPGAWDFSFGMCGEEPPPIRLTLDGECPGKITATASGAKPGSRVAFVRSSLGGCAGQTIIPPGVACTGTSLPIGGAVLVQVAEADAEGVARVTGRVADAACGNVCLIAIDLTSCALSNVSPF